MSLKISLLSLKKNAVIIHLLLSNRMTRRLDYYFTFIEIRYNFPDKGIYLTRVITRRNHIQYENVNSFHVRI